MLPQRIEQSAIDAVNAGADALIVTGSATGQATPLDTVREVKSVVEIPVLVGSGTNLENVKDTLQIADGAIVGSALKVDGKASNAVSLARSKAFMQKVCSG